MLPARRSNLSSALALCLILLLACTGTGCSSGIRRIEHRIEPLYSIEDPQFLRSVGSILGPGIVPGNRVTRLLNGDEIFPAMLEGIRAARETITFETFVYWSGDIGSEFAEAFAERARAGVKVHVLIDWYGSGLMDRGDMKAMREAGVEIERYNPLRWWNLRGLHRRQL